MLCSGRTGMKWQIQGIKHDFSQMLPLSSLVWWWGALWKYAFLHFCYFKNQLLDYRILRREKMDSVRFYLIMEKGYFQL